MKKGPSLPGWAVGLIIAVFLVAIVGVGMKFIGGGGPLPESQYPKEAFQAPGYSAPSGADSGKKDPKSGGIVRPQPQATPSRDAGGRPGSSGSPYGDRQ